MPKLTGIAMSSAMTRGDERADDRHQRAELFLHRIPCRWSTRNARPNFWSDGAAADHQRDEDRREQAEAAAGSGEEPRLEVAEEAAMASARATATRIAAHGGGCRVGCGCGGLAGEARAHSGMIPLTGSCGWRRVDRAPLSRSRYSRPPCRGVLDVLPRGLDHASTAVGHRHVVELVGHLVAVLERPVEELEHFAGRSRASPASCASG